MTPSAITATATPPVPSRGSGSEPNACPAATTPQPPAPCIAFTELFPPRDTDIAGHRSWLARSPWPEVVFASAR